MKNRRFRPLIYAGIALVVVWITALAVYHFAARTKMTAERLNQYAASMNLDQLSAAEREKALAGFAAKINSLTYEERLKWRRGEAWKKWFASLTEAERLKFIEATLPTGIKQMLDAFSALPDDQREKIIDNSLKRLKEQGANGGNNNGGDYGKNGSPPLSPELEQKARELGLQTFYSQSSAETKAELAPLLEQMQQSMRNGRVNRQ
jgi:hypothetical protein